MTEASRQAEFIVAPQKDTPWVIAVTSSSVVSDLTALAKLATYFSFQADGADVYLAFFQDNTVTVDDTATGKPAVGGCPKIPKDATVNIKLKPTLDAFAALKCASGSSAKLRIWQSGTPRVT